MKKIKVGSKVMIVKNTSGSINPQGSIGIVSEDKYGDVYAFRVIVKGISDANLGNSSRASDLMLIKKSKQEKIEKLLKKISKLNKE